MLVCVHMHGCVYMYDSMCKCVICTDVCAGMYMFMYMEHECVFLCAYVCM